MFDQGLSQIVQLTLPLTLLAALATPQCTPIPGDGHGAGGTTAGTAGAGTAGTGAAGEGASGGGTAGAGTAGAGTAGTAGCQGGGLAGAGGFSCGAVDVLRVNPNAAPGGDGRTWATALSSLQAAIDLQAARGGGEVWVLGGEFASLTTASEELVTLRSHVVVRGGFAGTESQAEERDPVTPRTVLQTLAGPLQALENGPLVHVSEATDVTLDRFALLRGMPGLRVESSRGVRIDDVVSTAPSVYVQASAELIGSEVRFEHAQFVRADSGVVMQVTDSDLSYVESSLVSSNEYVLQFECSNSRVLLERATVESVAFHLLGSQSLILDSTFRGFGIPIQTGSGIIRAEPGDGTLASVTTIAGSRFLGGHGSGETPVTAPSLFVWNSVFSQLRGGPVRSQSPTAAAIDATELEVALSTFYANTCSAPGPEGGNVCAKDIRTEAGSLIHNTLFAFEQPADDPQPRVAVEGTTSLIGNCTSSSLGNFEFTADNEPVAAPHPCPDAGDAASLEAARQRLYTRTAPFTVAPFSADLTRYRLPNWWREDSATFGQCTDLAAPDPGRHIELPCTARSVP